MPSPLGPGTQVSIRLDGLTVDGVPCRVGTSTQGTIVSMDGEMLTVELDAAFGLQTTVTVEPDRVRPRYG